MSRVGFLLREALVSLRRNILVVTGAVLAVFISLGLAFGALAVNELVRINTVAWQEGVHLIVWLNDAGRDGVPADAHQTLDRKSTRLNSSHVQITYPVFCSRKKNRKSTRLN